MHEVSRTPSPVLVPTLRRAQSRRQDIFWEGRPQATWVCRDTSSFDVMTHTYGAVRPVAGDGGNPRRSHMRSAALASGMALTLVVAAAWTSSDGKSRSHLSEMLSKSVATTMASTKQMLDASGSANGFLAKFYSLNTLMGASRPDHALTPEYLSSKTPISTKIMDTINLPDDEAFHAVDPTLPVDGLAGLWEGSFEVSTPGQYMFTTTSKAGSILYIDGSLVVDSGSEHTKKEQTGSASLEAGTHVLKATFYDNFGGHSRATSECRGGTEPGYVLKSAPQVVQGESINMEMILSSVQPSASTKPSISSWISSLASPSTAFGVLPELQKDITTGINAAQKRKLKDFVRDGGNLIVANPGAEFVRQFLHEIFDWSIENKSCSASTLQMDAAADTCWASCADGGCATLPLVGTQFCVDESSLPADAKVLWKSSDGAVSVFEVKVDSGRVVGLSDDFDGSSKEWDQVLKIASYFAASQESTMQVQYWGPDTKGDKTFLAGSHVNCGGDTDSVTCGTCPGGAQGCRGDCAFFEGSCKAYSGVVVQCGDHQAPSCMKCTDGDASMCGGDCGFSGGKCYVRGTTLLEDVIYLPLDGDFTDEVSDKFLTAMATAFSVEKSMVSIMKADPVENVGGFEIVFTVALVGDASAYTGDTHLEDKLNNALVAEGLPRVPFVRAPSVIPPEIAKYLENSAKGNSTYPQPPEDDDEEGWNKWESSHGDPRPCHPVPQDEVDPMGNHVTTYYADCSMAADKKEALAASIVKKSESLAARPLLEGKYKIVLKSSKKVVKAH